MGRVCAHCRPHQPPTPSRRVRRLPTLQVLYVNVRLSFFCTRLMSASHMRYTNILSTIKNKQKPKEHQQTPTSTVHRQQKAQKHPQNTTADPVAPIAPGPGLPI